MSLEFYPSAMMDRRSCVSYRRVRSGCGSRMALSAALFVVMLAATSTTALACGMEDGPDVCSSLSADKDSALVKECLIKCAACESTYECPIFTLHASGARAFSACSNNCDTARSGRARLLSTVLAGTGLSLGRPNPTTAPKATSASDPVIIATTPEKEMSGQVSRTDARATVSDGGIEQVDEAELEAAENGESLLVPNTEWVTRESTMDNHALEHFANPKKESGDVREMESGKEAKKEAEIEVNVLEAFGEGGRRGLISGTQESILQHMLDARFGPVGMEKEGSIPLDPSRESPLARAVSHAEDSISVGDERVRDRKDGVIARAGSEDDLELDTALEKQVVRYPSSSDGFVARAGSDDDIELDIAAEEKKKLRMESEEQEDDNYGIVRHAHTVGFDQSPAEGLLDNGLNVFTGMGSASAMNPLLMGVSGADTVQRDGSYPTNGKATADDDVSSDLLMNGLDVMGDYEPGSDYMAIVKGAKPTSMPSDSSKVYVRRPYQHTQHAHARHSKRSSHVSQRHRVHGPHVFASLWWTSSPTDPTSPLAAAITKFAPVFLAYLSSVTSSLQTAFENALLMASESEDGSVTGRRLLLTSGGGSSCTSASCRESWISFAVWILVIVLFALCCVGLRRRRTAKKLLAHGIPIELGFFGKGPGLAVAATDYEKGVAMGHPVGGASSSAYAPSPSSAPPPPPPPYPPGTYPPPTA
eukprot:TRINITY_DN23094_c0_g1_i1.p1 TRINITY_DN23094_c0_g1~~TRINITY_DN23094_c0_g1_i1.p1  ORF type:complete len:704 (+),score=86.27 TRINITY_DN23094_c0_g1_i1:298-2409(+)